MKNHIKVNGQLLQTNKKFSHLKQSQKQKIHEWFREANNLAIQKGISKKKIPDFMLFHVSDKIVKAGIHLPFEELEKFFQRKRSKFSKSN